MLSPEELLNLLALRLADDLLSHHRRVAEYLKHGTWILFFPSLRSKRFDLQIPCEQTEGFARILFSYFHVKRVTKIFFWWVRPAVPRKLMDSDASNSTSEKVRGLVSFQEGFLIHFVFSKVIFPPNFVSNLSTELCDDLI